MEHLKEDIIVEKLYDIKDYLVKNKFANIKLPPKKRNNSNVIFIKNPSWLEKGIR